MFTGIVLYIVVIVKRIYYILVIFFCENVTQKRKIVYFFHFDR